MVAFPVNPKPVSDVWGRVSGYLQTKRLLPKQFEVSQLAGHEEKFKSEQCLKLAPDEITQLIIERKLSGFLVCSGNIARSTSLDFWLVDAKNLGGQSRLFCRMDYKAKSPDDWNQLIENIMEEHCSIGAWQWNSYYNSWQRSSVLDGGYERLYGVLPPTAKTYIEKSIDGIGPDRIRIDNSRNPGRGKELIPTIYFHPTAEMWLGPHFWQYAKCTIEEALAADFFIEKRHTAHYLYLKCWPEAFTRPDGEQGRMQQRLWKLFFHEDCEWPPGSGGICDEPIYGPRELMPPPK